MKIYKTQQEVEADIKDDKLLITGDVRFQVSINISASIIVTAGDIFAWDIFAWDITARDITARNITARNITARDIFAWDIFAWDITAKDITARNITARNITAGDIFAWDIFARNITARDITAGNILYYAFCCVYKFITCLSIKATREKAHPPICLGGEHKYEPRED